MPDKEILFTAFAEMLFQKLLRCCCVALQAALMGAILLRCCKSCCLSRFASGQMSQFVNRDTLFSFKTFFPAYTNHLR